tara:strand:+ start:790 stop:1464 length:675 start_codon:yes stop_codon:yes gene_type:complete
MLALKLGLSLNTQRIAVFAPTDETSLEAWYRKASGITESSGAVSEWSDQSSNSINMVQATAGEKPTFANAVITFDGSDNLQSTSQISLTGDYTVGVKLKPTGTIANYAVLGDNTTAGQFIKLQDEDTIYVKSGGTVKGISITDGSLFTDGGYFVLTRDSSNFTLFWNGVQQSQVTAVAGTQLIDTIGGRYIDTEDYVGDITEIQVYSSTSAALSAKINTRFSTL